MKIKLKRLVLFLLVLSIPFQLGRHFWLAESFVKSFRLDYLSPTVYVSDILVLFYLLLERQQLVPALKKLFRSHLGVAFLILFALNFTVSSFSLVTLFAWISYLLFYLLFCVLRSTPGLLSQIALPFCLSGVIVIMIAFLQLAAQSSLGGPFYLLGERPLSLALPNIAKLQFSSLVILRPYSTFSHPNSLAGYLLVSLLILSLIKRTRLLRLLTICAIVVTFSKSAILALVLLKIVQINFIQSLWASLALSTLPLLKNLFNQPSWLGLSLSSRFYLLTASLKVLAGHLLLGVGLRRFVVSLGDILPPNQISYLSLQPVHNLLLIVIGEIGLIGMVLVLATARKIFQLAHNQNQRLYLSRLAAAVILTGSLDHYWWTLHQNQLIIVLALALILSSTSKAIYTTNQK